MILSTRLKQEKEGEQHNSNQEEKGPGADPGFFLGGGAPLRNDVTDGEVKKILKRIRIYEEESFILPLDPPLRVPLYLYMCFRTTRSSRHDL